VSHDTDKLIRQLSLVAFLMAERRAVTARDIKGQVEGYQEMSDEAFARRFYSDRAELIALGVPLHSQRDEYTGEELYNMRSERYFLPPLERPTMSSRRCRPACTCSRASSPTPSRCGSAAEPRARPRGLRRGANRHRAARRGARPEYSVEMQGRLGKLEAAISKQRTVKFPYWSISRDEERERTVNPYALFRTAVPGTSSGSTSTPRTSARSASPASAARSASPPAERDFRLPPEFDVDRYRGRPPWQIGDAAGEARIEVAGDTAWWVERTFGAKVEDASS
jgi:proteasome accessory factor C